MAIINNNLKMQSLHRELRIRQWSLNWICRNSAFKVNGTIRFEGKFSRTPPDASISATSLSFPDPIVPLSHQKTKGSGDTRFAVPDSRSSGVHIWVVNSTKRRECVPSLCVEQKEAMSNMVVLHKDILIILPTGFAPSCHIGLFFLPVRDFIVRKLTNKKNGISHVFRALRFLVRRPRPAKRNDGIWEREQCDLILEILVSSLSPCGHTGRCYRSKFEYHVKFLRQASTSWLLLLLLLLLLPRQQLRYPGIAFDWLSVTFFDHWPIRMPGLLLFSCAELPLFCMLLPENCISLSQAESRNLFHVHY